MAEQFIAQADGDAAETAAKSVPQISAEEDGKGRRGHIVGQQHDTQGVMPGGGGDVVQPLPGLLQRGDLPAQPPAQVVVPGQQIHVVAVAGHPADLGQGLALRGEDADVDTVGDDEGFHPVDAVGKHKPFHGILHPVDLRPADQKAIAQVGGQGEKSVIVHVPLPPFCRVCFAFYLTIFPGKPQGEVEGKGENFA